MIREQHYVPFLTWENGGRYMIGMKAVAGHQTIEIDVKKLRDEQTPDETGQVIPLNVTKGQLRWSLKRTMIPAPGEETRDSLALAGRTEQIDIEHGVSSNYACQNWCDSNYHSSYLSPVNSQLEAGETATFQVFQQDYDHYGILTGYYLRIQILHGPTYWSSNTTSVATINSSSALATAVAPGTTTLTATWQDYTAPEYTMCEPYRPTSEKSDLSSAPVQQLGLGDTCDACLSYTVFPTPSVALTVAPTVQKVQYKEPGTSIYADITGTLFVLKGTEVEFKAIPNPPAETFPSGKPVWSGTSGATGTGQVKSVTFDTVSSSASNFRTVVATSGNSSVTVNVVVYELTGTLTPQDMFHTNRSKIKFGLEELVDLAFTTNPSSITSTQAGGLRWEVNTGSGTIPNNTDGTETYTAPEIAESSNLRLTIQGGPSKGLFFAKGITVVAPSGGYAVKTSNVAHNQGAFGGGFRSEFYLEPKDVSFKNIKFGEGTCAAAASGYLAHLNGVPHTATATPASIINCHLSNGCKVNGLDEYLSHIDPAPTPYANGSFSWEIPWKYFTTNSVNGASFVTATHSCTANTSGDAELSKKNLGPYTVHVNDATTGF